MGPQLAVKTQTKRQQAMAANYVGTRGTYSVHMINQKNVINVHSNDVILPVLTSPHTQREQTIINDDFSDAILNDYYCVQQRYHNKLLKVSCWLQYHATTAITQYYHKSQ